MKRFALVALSCACSAPAPEPPQPQPPPPVPAPPPEPEVDPPIHECGQDPTRESPIVEGELGEGERYVEVINNSGSSIQARLLTESLEPAVPGTLHVPADGRGKIHVPEGVYVLRYRHGASCDVRRGKPLTLVDDFSAVQIAIEPHFDSGQSSDMREVEEPL